MSTRVLQHHINSSGVLTQGPRVQGLVYYPPCSAWKFGIFETEESFATSTMAWAGCVRAFIFNPLDGAMEPANWRWPRVSLMCILCCGCKWSCFYLGLAKEELLILHATVIHGKQIWSLRRDQKNWRSRSGETWFAQGYQRLRRVSLVVVCDYWRFLCWTSQEWLW